MDGSAGGPHSPSQRSRHRRVNRPAWQRQIVVTPAVGPRRRGGPVALTAFPGPRGPFRAGWGVGGGGVWSLAGHPVGSQPPPKIWTRTHFMPFTSNESRVGPGERMRQDTANISCNGCLHTRDNFLATIEGDFFRPLPPPPIPPPKPLTPL